MVRSGSDHDGSGYAMILQRLVVQFYCGPSLARFDHIATETMVRKGEVCFASCCIFIGKLENWGISPDGSHELFCLTANDFRPKPP